ncbi:MAG: hypothetical protein PHX61_01655 [Alphaproteobacteria bacterium]|nr:hypothetical protein [Alphaproteobacteria bacterium]OIN85823.1 MAG: hypothetical protein AUJ12_07755 [Alphaproteobacteria bacterium CG1_02_46_17]
MAKEEDPKVYLVKAKLYRFTSLLFVTIGIFVFCVLYVKYIDGRLLESLKSPYTIFYFLVPFAPGAVLTILADRAEKKYRSFAEKK